MESQTEISDISFLVNTNNQIAGYYTHDKSLLFAPPESFLEQNFMDVLPPSESQTFTNAIEQVRKTKKSVHIQYDLTLPDGVHHFSSQYEPCINILGEVDLIIVLIKDVTALKAQEALLDQTMNRYRTIFESASSGIVFGNKHNEILECNQAYCDFLEVTKEELLKKDISSFTISEDNITEAALLKELVKGNSDEYRLIKRYVTANNIIKWGDLRVSTIRNPQNNSVYFIGIVNDVTESINTKEALKQANNAKDKLLSIIGHDLRTPLNNILSLLYLLKEDEASSKEYLNMIDTSAQQALELLENLLVWGNSQTNVLQIHLHAENINEIIVQSIAVVQSNADAKQITLKLHDTQNVVASVDKNMIYTVVRNLLSNAIKFTHNGGKIDCFIGADDTFFWIEVTDTGVGMDATTINCLFDPVSKVARHGTKNEPGNGLGLLICKEFVQKHNGTITVTSEPQKGSSFKLTIPLHLN